MQLLLLQSQWLVSRIRILRFFFFYYQTLWSVIFIPRTTGYGLWFKNKKKETRKEIKKKKKTQKKNKQKNKTKTNKKPKPPPQKKHGKTIKIK